MIEMSLTQATVSVLPCRFTLTTIKAVMMGHALRSFNYLDLFILYKIRSSSINVLHLRNI